jgi:hypothetical protein
MFLDLLGEMAGLFQTVLSFSSGPDNQGRVRLIDAGIC